MNNNLDDCFQDLLPLIIDDNSIIESVFKSVQVGLSIALNLKFPKILHNPAGNRFLRLDVSNNSADSAKDQYQVSDNEKVLSSTELPIYKAAYYGEVTSNKELIFLWDDGVKKTAIVNATPIFGKSGELLGAVEVIYETTKQRQLEKNLEHFFNLSADSFNILDFKGNIIQTNPAFMQSLGFEESVVGNPVKGAVLGLIHPDDLPGTFKAINRLISGQPVAMYENRLRCANGEYKWLSWNCYASVQEGLIYAVGRDIGEHKRFQTELQDNNRQVMDILESISDAFFSLDQDGRFFYVNQEAKRLFAISLKATGQSIEDFTGLTLSDAFPGYIDFQTCELFESVKKTKIPAHFEMKLPNSEIEIDVHVYPYERGISVCFRNITERKKKEKEMQRSEELKLVGEIAASIGHEIRNPLSTVRGYLQLLENKDFIKDNYKDQFDLMIEELDRANEILTGFLSLAKINKTEYKKQDLNSIIEKILPIARANAMEQDIALVTDLGEIPELTLDEKSIRQVLLNFIRNGLDAMSGSGQITIKTFRENNRVILTIQDQGHGIPPEVMENIGKPFITTKENGTGLGLAVCFRLLHEHDATIKLDSNTDGTTIIIKFKIDED